MQIPLQAGLARCLCVDAAFVFSFNMFIQNKQHTRRTAQKHTKVRGAKNQGSDRPMLYSARVP